MVRAEPAQTEARSAEPRYVTRTRGGGGGGACAFYPGKAKNRVDKVR